MNSTTDALRYREVLGQYPTGVCVVTAMQGDNRPAGFVIGSFTSVSLDPPLVAFFPDKKSSSWPKIETTGHFCVNILSADQEHLCRQFASKSEDKFAGVRVRNGVTGAPIIEDVVAWIECDLESVTEAGDHYIVLGRVRDMRIEKPALPLLFFQGGYGRFSPLSLAAPIGQDALTNQLREVDLVRHEMEQLTEKLQCRCVATVPVDDDIVVVASAGSAAAGARATMVGVRMPAARPHASSFGAWLTDEDAETWVSALTDPALRAEQLRRMRTVRERGYSLGLLNDAQRRFASTVSRMAEDPDSLESQSLRTIMRQLDYEPEHMSADVRNAVRVIAAPVFRGESDVAMVLTLYGFSDPGLRGGIDHYIEELLASTTRASSVLSDHHAVSA